MDTKLNDLSIVKESKNSFTYLLDCKPVEPWHFHSEMEIIYILKGAGKCIVGDNIGKFQEKQLFLFGPNLPHELICDATYLNANNGFLGQNIKINFKEDFLGKEFFKLPENKRILRIINLASQGCLFNRQISNTIGHIMESMLQMNAEQRFYTLLDIFKQLALADEFQLLASPHFSTNFQPQQSNSLINVVSFIMQNFQKKILLKDMLQLANMSSTSFSVAFKKSFNLTFSEFLLKVRIDYACSLLSDNKLSINQVSSQAGFENLSNFNRLFKKAKATTPKDYKKKAMEEIKLKCYN